MSSATSAPIQSHQDAPPHTFVSSNLSNFLWRIISRKGAAKIQMATRKYTHSTEIGSTPPPIYSLLLSSVISRKQGLLGGAEAFFLSSSQILKSTDITDKQTSQSEADFLSKSTMLSET